MAQICETSAFAIIQLSPLFLPPFIILTLTDKHNLILKNLIIALWVGVISVGASLYAAIISVRSTAGSHYRHHRSAQGVCQNKVQDRGAALAESLKAWSVYLFILIFILVSAHSVLRSMLSSRVIW